MKIRVHLPGPDGSFNLIPIVRFALTKIEEIETPDTTEPEPILIALVLAGTVEDHQFHDRFRLMIATSSDESERIFAMSDLFLRVLYPVPPDPTVCLHDNSEYSRSDEAICLEILQYALKEGTKMLSDQCLEPQIFKVLMGAGLQCWRQRLCEFEEMSRQTDPETAIRRGIEIIGLVTSSEMN